MQEVVAAGIDYLFRERGLHRIMASYMPANLRSGALLERLGFEQEVRSGLSDDQRPLGGPRPHRAHQSGPVELCAVVGKGRGGP